MTDRTENGTPAELETRVGKLERENDRLRWLFRLVLLGVALGVPGVLLLTGFGSSDPDAPGSTVSFDSVEVRHLTLVDERGLPRLELGTDQPDPPIFGRRFKRNAAPSAGIIFYDANKMEQGGIITPDRGGIYMGVDAKTGQRGSLFVNAAGDRAGMNFYTSTSEGRRASSFGIFGRRGPSLTLTEEGDTLAHLPDGSRAGKARDRSGGGDDAEDGDGTGSDADAPDPGAREPVWSASPGPPMAMAAYSPSGERVATAGHDGTVYLWDAEDGTERGRLEGHDGEVYDVAFLAGGEQLVSTSHDGRVILWDVSEQRPVREWDVPLWATDVAVTPDGRLMYGSVGGSDVWIVPRDGGSPRKLGSDHRVVSAVAATETTDRLASASGNIEVWSRGSPGDKVTMSGHRHLVLSMDFTGDGRLVSGSLGGTIRVWDVESGEQLEMIEPDLPMPMIDVSPDGERVAAGGSGHHVVLWRLGEEGPDRKVVGEHELNVTGVAFSPDGRRLVSTGIDGAVHVWNVSK